MKSRTRLSTLNTNKPLTIDSKAKIYVPITIGAQNLPPPPPVHEPPSSTGSDLTILQLKKANSQLKQKQEIYIDKLIKLEEGLEKQHLEFKQLQDLYNQLLNSYKRKEEEIGELEQNYRESNRKRESSGTQFLQPQVQQNKNTENQLRRQIEEQKSIIEKLELDLSQSNGKINELSKNIQRLFSENIYYKNKDKMNDSRASLNSKVFEELGEWQRQADIEKEEKIKLEYENKFLRNRNQDLENRMEELEQILVKKQAEVLKLRQNNIVLSRENSQNRLQRSASRSPHKAEQKQPSPKKSPSKPNRIIDQLYQQNKALKKQLQEQKKTLETSKPNDYFIKQQQFYSFSQEHDGHSNHSSNQSGHRAVNKELFIKIENHYDVRSGEEEGEGRKRGSSPILQADQLNHSDQSLQELPAELEIDNLILKNKKKEQNSS